MGVDKDVKGKLPDWVYLKALTLPETILQCRFGTIMAQYR